MRWRDFEALTFDCYGTLIDWESGMLASLREWARRHRLDAPDHALLERFGELEHVVERENPATRYSEILFRVHGRLAESFGVPADEADARRFAASIRDWPPFPDSPAALQRLKRRFQLIVVSNVDRESFAHSNRRLGVDFDAIVTAEDVGAYKPDRRMFEAAFAAAERLGVARHRILHVAQSLYHDHEPAKALGMKTVWVDRRRGRSGGGATRAPITVVQPDWTVGTLAEFSDVVDRA